MNRLKVRGRARSEERALARVGRTRPTSTSTTCGGRLAAAASHTSVAADDNTTTAVSRWQRWQVPLIGGDALALLIGFVLPLFITAGALPRSPLVNVAEALLLVGVGLWAMRFQGLWRARVVAVRAIELSKIGRALGILAVFTLMLDRKSSMEVRAADVLVALTVAFVLVVAWRSAHRWYVANERRNGRFTSRVVIVGADSRAAELDRLFNMHPELGMRTVAVVGSREQALRNGVDRLWAGELMDAGAVIDDFAADAVILCTGDLNPAFVHTLTAQARVEDRVVYVDPGLSRVDFRRVHMTAWAHQPVFSLEPTRLALFELALKRVFDVAVAGVVLLLAIVPMLAIALGVKLTDGGPVFFRQQRVGRHGETFGMVKFRTMVVDAEARLAELQQGNERKGPLFKMERDPRITRIGHFLRATSLDELPQLFNVLGGTMSIVGPRPALPKEVADFPEDLNARHLVRPGITGLWQTEARDNPDFEAYRRLDLFYVENWSLSLDMVIMLATADQILLRPLFKKLKRSAPAVAADELTTVAVPGAHRLTA